MGSNVGKRVIRDRWGEPIAPLAQEASPKSGFLPFMFMRRIFAWAHPGTKRSAQVLVERLAALYATHGERCYGEGVSQRDHALQAALLAERAGKDSAMITAALLHDIGHLLQKRGEDAALRGFDSRHEAIAAGWLARYFGPEVYEPIRLHVEAKRYLCAVEPSYDARLSSASKLSLALQGGAMSATEAAGFAAREYAANAIQLRRWDEGAKRVGAAVPAFTHFQPHIEAALV